MSAQTARMTTMERIDNYLKLTGQTKEQLLAGEQYFGLNLIMELIDKAVATNKKIVWKDEPDKGIGAMSYSFENI